MNTPGRDFLYSAPDDVTATPPAGYPSMDDPAQDLPGASGAGYHMQSTKKSIVIADDHDHR